MTERDEMQTPSLAEARERYIDGFPIDTWVVARSSVGADFDRMIEAVRQEERERIVSVVESWFDDYNGTDPGVGGWYALEANLDVWIREQGKEQGA